jgi:hypothetical protein
MPEKNYQHRDILDKLGIQASQAIATWEIDPALLQRIIERTDRDPATEDEALDMALVTIDETSNAVEVLKQWRQRLTPNGSIWLLTAKRGQPGYVDQRELIAAGQQAEVVDNKICSVSPTVSAMRFVIRKKDRQA